MVVDVRIDREMKDGVEEGLEDKRKLLTSVREQATSLPATSDSDLPRVSL